MLYTVHYIPYVQSNYMPYTVITVYTVYFTVLSELYNNNGILYTAYRICIIHCMLHTILEFIHRIMYV
jgi:hypothetical protein